MVLGSLLEGQALTSTIGLFKGICAGQILAMMFGICDAADTAEVHVAGLDRPETAGQRYLVCCKDQYSTLELAQMAFAAGAAGVDIAAWQTDEAVQKLALPKKPSTDNRKVSAMLGRELIAPEVSVQLAVASLKAQGHL